MQKCLPDPTFTNVIASHYNKYNSGCEPVVGAITPIKVLAKIPEQELCLIDHFPTLATLARLIGKWWFNSSNLRSAIAAHSLMICARHLGMFLSILSINNPGNSGGPDP